MKKIMLGVVGLSLALSFAPAHAEAGNGCNVVGQGPTEALTCSYTAKAGSATLVDASPNTVVVTETHLVNGQPVTTTIYNCDADVCKAPPAKTLTMPVGSTVKITFGPDCVPATPVCGTVGFATLYETS